MSIKKDFYKIQSKKIIDNLAKRQMEGYYCESVEEAISLANSFLKENDIVSYGGSMTLVDTKMLDSLRANSSIQLLDRVNCSTPSEFKQLYHDALSANVYFMSTNAITINGELVNIDGNGNRVAALIYGPDSVVILAGMNKVTNSVEEALSRVHNTATPQNCIRLNKNTPCTITGQCADCLSPDCICNQVVVTRRSGYPNRIKVILIGEELGY